MNNWQGRGPRAKTTAVFCLNLRRRLAGWLAASRYVSITWNDRRQVRRGENKNLARTLAAHCRRFWKRFTPLCLWKIEIVYNDHVIFLMT